MKALSKQKEKYIMLNSLNMVYLMEIKINQEEIINHIKDSISVKEKLLNDEKSINNILTVSQVCLESIKKGNKIMLAGMVVQLIHNTLQLNLLVDSCLIKTARTSFNNRHLSFTAIGNDYGFDMVFSRQIESLGKEGDVLVYQLQEIKNVIKALKCCNERNIIAIGLTGQDSCEMDNYCNYIINIPSNITARIQESHILVGHIICSIVESSI